MDRRLIWAGVGALLVVCGVGAVAAQAVAGPGTDDAQTVPQIQARGIRVRQPPWR
jgi:hypothetical protein